MAGNPDPKTKNINLALAFKAAVDLYNAGLITFATADVAAEVFAVVDPLVEGLNARSDAAPQGGGGRPRNASGGGGNSRPQRNVTPTGGASAKAVSYALDLAEVKAPGQYTEGQVAAMSGPEVSQLIDKLKAS